MNSGINAISNASDITSKQEIRLPSRSGKRNLIIYNTFKLDDVLRRKLMSAGWEVSLAADAEAISGFINSRECRVGLILIDNHADRSNLERLSSVFAAGESVLWVALTAQGCNNNNSVCRLIATYCHDYHTLPVDTDKLLYSLGHAWGMYEINTSIEESDNDPSGMGGMVGESESMLQLYRDISKVALSDAPVLLTGESGTGKELTARTLHRNSNRAGEPFIAVNCAALPATLIQSELFGHEKGAFTGASQRRIGRFEAADGGTIFLDEIGDLPLELQTNLLRFLEESVIERLGSTSGIPINARVIAATHENLEDLIARGCFREDLYYRLNVLQINVPSLRDRANDIELLARQIFNRYSSDNRSQSRGFSQKALRAMAGYSWPGNVRELINRIRRAMVMSEGGLITPEDLGLVGSDAWQPRVSLEEKLMEVTRQAITTALQRTHNNVSRAARELAVSRATLYRLMNKYNICV